MNKNGNKVLRCLKASVLMLVVFAFVSSSTYQANATNSSSKLNNLYNQKSDIDDQIKESSQSAKEKKAEGVDLTNSINKLESNISETETKINSLDSQIDQTANEIVDTENQISQREKELEIENDNRKGTLIELYKTGRKNLWELLISSKTLSEAINHNYYFENLESRLEATINKITKMKDDLENKKTDLDKTKAELAALKGEQQAYRQSLGSQKKEKEVVLVDAQSQQKKYEDQVAEAKKLNKQVEAQIASVQASIRRAQDSGKGVAPRNRGTSPVGFSWPANYKYISCYYGESTPFQSFHTGIDLANIPGTPIYAASSGTVITVKDMMVNGHYYGYGKYVVIGHNAKYSSLYAHLMSYIVSPGQEVKKGDTIGYMGNTGWSTGPHLHFEIWDNGNRANPINYLP